MKTAEVRYPIRSVKAGTIVQFLAFRFPLLLAVGWGLYGCSVIQPTKVAYDTLSVTYEQTKLKSSGSLDVLKAMRSPEQQLKPGRDTSYLVTQSDTIVASLGQSKKGYKTCFTMVAFDEHTLTAKRKYFYLVDERASPPPTQPLGYLTGPAPGLKFDCQIVLPTGLLAQPYASEEARQAAILNQVAEYLRQDIRELTGPTDTSSQGGQILTVSGMVINQTFNAVSLQLAKSGVSAERLSGKSGFEFNHMSFDKGRIRLVLDEDIATVKIRLGVFRHDFARAEAPGAGRAASRELLHRITTRSDSI